MLLVCGAALGRRRQPSKDEPTGGSGLRRIPYRNGTGAGCYGFLSADEWSCPQDRRLAVGGTVKTMDADMGAHRNTAKADGRRLSKQDQILLVPSQPFNFKGTIWKPSHFPAPTERFEEPILRFSMRFKNRIFGIKLWPERTSKGEDAIRVAIYAAKPLSPPLREGIVTELRWRFDLDADLRGFLELAQSDDLLRPVVGRWCGMRVHCKLSLSELLVISVVLQNATVRRSVQMLDTLLRRYGRSVRFDRTDLYAFWRSSRLAQEPEATLRGLKLGYRAKTLVRQANDLVKPAFSEPRLRELDQDKLRDRLLSLYGVGPASVGILLFESFHYYDSLDHISPWEQQIYSRLLFDEPLVPVDAILAHIEGWRPWRMLAMHYLFEDLFWRHRAKPVDWLARVIRL